MSDQPGGPRRNSEREVLSDFESRLKQRLGNAPAPPARAAPPRQTVPPSPPPPSPPPSYDWPTPSPARRLPIRGCLTVMAAVVAVLLLVGGPGLGLLWFGALQRGPIHVLVLGTDERPTEPGPFRSDTMILARFDPGQRQVRLLSIPRDLWVPIPDNDFNRVNTAHFFGGPALAKTTVAGFLQTDVKYYAKLNFGGFEQVVDALGGVDVFVSETLHDENYPTPDYGVTTIHFEAGQHHFTGAEALIYARSRYSTSDFDRARRQQEILDALQARLLSPGGLIRIPAMIGAFASAVETDMPAGEWVILTLILASAGNIERMAIGPGETYPDVTSGGAQVLMPNPDAIQALLTTFFGP